MLRSFHHNTLTRSDCIDWNTPPMVWEFELECMEAHYKQTTHPSEFTSWPDNSSPSRFHSRTQPPTGVTPKRPHPNAPKPTCDYTWIHNPDRCDSLETPPWNNKFLSIPLKITTHTGVTPETPPQVTKTYSWFYLKAQSRQVWLPRDPTLK